MEARMLKIKHIKGSMGFLLGLCYFPATKGSAKLEYTTILPMFARLFPNSELTRSFTL